MVDRRGSRIVVGGGVVIAALSWPVFALLPGLPGLILGLWCCSISVCKPPRSAIRR